MASMRTFLHEHAAPGRARLMSASERDEIDSVASEFLAVASKRLDALTASLDRPLEVPLAAAEPNAHHRAHIKAALAILLQQLSALAAHADDFRAAFAAEAAELRGRELVSPALYADDAHHHSATAERGWEEMAGCELEAGDLSADERQLLEAENAQLHADLASMVDEVRSAESKVLEISALSATFAASLSEQAEAIEHIHADTASAADYVRSGNRSLQSAEQHARGFRLYQMLFFVAAACTLLLADWWYS